MANVTLYKQDGSENGTGYGKSSSEGGAGGKSYRKGSCNRDKGGS